MKHLLGKNKGQKMKAQIGISEVNSQMAANELMIILADEYVLYTKTKKAHWNVEGPDFIAKHRFFESQFGELDQLIDQLAERIRSIGHFPEATLRSFLQLTRFTEMSREENNSKGFIIDLLSDHESLIISLRENIHRFSAEFHDQGSSDFITGLMKVHEKMAWFLRAHI